MELNSTNITETEVYTTGTYNEVRVYDRSGSGAVHLETITATGPKRLTAPIDDAMIDKEGADGAILPVHGVRGGKIKFVNDGFTSVQVEFRSFTT